MVFGGVVLGVVVGGRMGVVLALQRLYWRWVFLVLGGRAVRVVVVGVGVVESGWVGWGGSKGFG